MKAIQINFEPLRPAQIIASMRSVHWLLAGIGLAMGIAGMVAVQYLTERQNARQAELEQIQSLAVARFKPSVSAKKLTLPEAQAGAVNKAIQQLNLPWGNLLTAIERATPASVALLELQPDAKRHFVKVLAETNTPRSMLAYITRLKQQPFIGNVILTRHEVNDQDSERLLRFEIVAEWTEAGQ